MAQHGEAGVRREIPKDADETDEEEKGVHHADAEFRREFGEQATILLEALVRLGSRLTDEAELVSAVRLQPKVQQNVRETFSQPDLEAFLKPRLAHDQHEQG